MGSNAKPMEAQELVYCLSFPEEAEKSYSLLYNVFSDAIFYLHRTTIVSGVENYPSGCMSCCSDDLALLLPCLDLWILWSKNISVWEEIFASIWIVMIEPLVWLHSVYLKLHNITACDEISHAFFPTVYEGALWLLDCLSSYTSPDWEILPHE